MGETIILTIKKVFFDQILSGEKKVEYRRYSTFFEKKFINSPKILVLYYQKMGKLIIQIKSIDVIKTPKFLKEQNDTSKLTWGEQVFEIKLGRVKLVNNCKIRKGKIVAIDCNGETISEASQN